MKAKHFLNFTILLMMTSCSSLADKQTTAVMATKVTHPAIEPATLVTKPVPETPLVFFTSEKGKFQVWLPGAESMIDYTIQQTLFEETIECPNIVFRLNGATAAIQYCDLVPQSIASLSSDQVLDQAQSEIIQDMNMKLDTQSRGLVQDTYPAQTLSGQVDMRGMGYDGTFKGRLILAENRLYFVVMSVYHEDWCNCLHQINQVVDSLNIDHPLSIPFEPTP